jgi:zinc transport system permease protein
MSDFMRLAIESDVIRNALIAGLLACVASGVIGTYVVVRRITYIASGIAHCVFGGMGAAFYMQVEFKWSWCEPIYGATVAAILSAVIIGLVSLKARQREDTVIGAIWTIGMAAGVLFIHKADAYSPDLMSYLFGNILWVSPRDLLLTGLLDVLVLALGLLFYNQFLAVCFDEEFSRLRGVSVEFFYLLLLCLTALTVVVMVKVVGIVLVIALLTLPVAIAGNFARTLWQMMLVAASLCVVFSTAGLAICYELDTPAGATIAMLSGAAYIVVAAAHALRARRRGA